MKTLHVLLDDYLTTHRMLGAKLEESERLLHQFIGFLTQHEAEHITTELALEWATLPREARPPTGPVALRKSAILPSTPAPSIRTTRFRPRAFCLMAVATAIPTSTATEKSPR